MTNENTKGKDSTGPLIVNTYVPPMELVHFVQALFNPDVKGRIKTAAKVTGVDKGKFYHALKKPEFKKWLADQVKDFLARNAPRVATALMKECLKGNVPAIRTYYELEGRLKSGTSFTSINNDIKQPLIIIGPPDPTKAIEGPGAEVIDVPQEEPKP